MTDIPESPDLKLDDDEYEDSKIDDPRDYQTGVWEDKIQPYLNGLAYKPMIIFVHEAWEKTELDGYVYVMPQSYTKQQFIDQFGSDDKAKELWNHFSLMGKNCFAYGHLNPTEPTALPFPVQIDAHVYRVNFFNDDTITEKAAWCVVDGVTYGRPILDLFI